MVIQGRTLVTAATMEMVVMVAMVAMPGAEVRLIAKNVNNMIVMNFSILGHIKLYGLIHF